METESIESIKAKVLEKFGKELEATANVVDIVLDPKIFEVSGGHA